MFYTEVFFSIEQVIFPQTCAKAYKFVSQRSFWRTKNQVVLDFELNFISLLLVPVRKQHGPPDTETDKSVMTKEIILVKTNICHLSSCQIHYCSKDLL